MKTIINTKLILVVFLISLISDSLYSVAIKNSAGTTYPAKFSNNETVMSIKQKLAKETGMKLQEINLSWRPKANQKDIKLLQDDCKLIAYGILDNDTLIMKLKKY